MKREHPYLPNESQRLFHSAQQRFKGFMGAKGSGKTRTLIEECIMLLYEFPGNVGVVARKDFPALERTTMKYFLDWIPKELIYHFNAQKRILEVRTKDPQKTSLCYFVQEKEPKEFDSMELGFFAIDEADECPHETFKLLRSRLRLKDVAKYGLLAFNPTNRLHWLYNFFVLEPQEKPKYNNSRILLRNNTYENLHNLSPEYIDELKETYAGDELNRFLLGEWGSTANEWSVYQEYRSSFHVAKDKLKVIPGLPVLRAWDFGMRAGCLCAQLFDGQLRVLHPEVMRFNQGADVFIPIVLSEQGVLFNEHQIIDFSDPTFVANRNAAVTGATCKKELMRYGISVHGGTKEFDKRTSAVNYFLTKMKKGEPCLLIDPRCKYLIGGFEGGYKFRENAYNRQAEDVVKNEYSEVHDCLQHIAVFARKEMLRESTGFAPKHIPKEGYIFGRRVANR